MAFLMPAARSSAQLVTGTSVSNADVPNGLVVTIDTRWPGGHGYRPVRVEVKSLVPAVANRTFLFELRCFSLHTESGVMEVKQYVDLPAGVDQVQATIAVPEQFQVGGFECDVYEDGRYRRALSIKKGTGAGWSLGYQGWEEASPAVLIVGDAPFDSSSWFQLFPAAMTNRNWSALPAPGNTAVAPAGTAYPAALTLAEGQLPRRWIDYSGIDVIVLSLAQAESLAASRKESWTAISRWTAAGGNLWVYGMGSDWQGLARLEKLLALPELPSPDNAVGSGPRGWTLPEPSQRMSLLLGVDQTMNLQVQQATAFGQTVEPAAPQPAAAPDEPPPAHFVSRRKAIGLVVALSEEQVFPSDSARWGWVFNHVGPGRYLWARRNGFSLHSDNPDFWTWFISGVGLAPVGTFAVLITLFVIFIGPVNYWWLRRRGKLHLLLVSVPVCALFVTGALFAYGLIADGLSVRTRFRTYTEIDQPQGEAVCWSRSCYYAALSPSGGLQFPDDMLISPYEDVSQFYNYNSGLRRAVDWTDQGQQLRSGWLPARNQTQFMTVRARATPAKLLIEPANTTPSGWNVTNQLQTPVSRLLVIAPDGTPWTARDLAANATAQLVPANMEDEAAAFHQAVADNARTSLPPEVRADELVSSRRGRRYRYGYYANPSEVRLLSGRLEILLGESIMAEPPSARLPKASAGDAPATTQKFKQIGPRMYLALVAHSPEAAAGLPHYREEESLHLVVGRW